MTDIFQISQTAMSSKTARSSKTASNAENFLIDENIRKHLANISLPQPKSRKGQNGKLLIIGGSQLFHAASKWSLDVASRFVDMVFYASAPSNNELVKQAKGAFWNGIVIEQETLLDYLEEADCILIGPGMLRDEAKTSSPNPEIIWPLEPEVWNQNTKAVVDTLIFKYPDKKWVVDAGALQMVSPGLLNQKCVITPHERELKMLLDKFNNWDESLSFSKSDVSLDFFINNSEKLTELSKKLSGATILLKGWTDVVADSHQAIKIPGGSAGMTKGGTGDVLSGLVSGLLANSSPFESAVVASSVCKTSGAYLSRLVGPFFNASDLAAAISEVFWKMYQQAQPA